MSLAFDLQKDKPLREDNPLRPYKIVSVWTVLRHHAQRFTDIIASMARVRPAFHPCRAPACFWEQARLAKNCLNIKMISSGFAMFAQR